MTTYRFTLAFRGVDPWDDDLVEELAEHLPRVHWGTVDGEVRATAFVYATTAMHAVRDTVNQIKAIVPGAQPLHVVEDFVAIPDIAKRTGMNRETIRLWTLGERGPGDFPRTRGTVGNNVRVWDWAAVSAWLRRHYELGDPESHLSPSEIARLNDLFSALSTGTHRETLAKRLKVVPRTGCWSPASQVRRQTVPTRDGLSPAAA